MYRPHLLRPLLLGLAVFLACSCRPALAAWTIKIGPYEEACFLLRGTMTDEEATTTEEGQQQPKTVEDADLNLSGNYELLDQRLSAEPLLVYVMLDVKTVWHSTPNTPYDRFTVPLQRNKRYWVCLQNSSHGPNTEGEEQEHPDHKERVVGFTYRVHSRQKKKTVSTELTQEQEEKFYDWLDAAEDITDDLNDYVDHFSYAKRREADHRALVERTFSACLTWTMLEVSCVIVMALGQVFVYRQFLEKKQKGYNYY